MLLAFSRSGLVAEAKQIFDAIPQHNSVSWDAMLVCYAQSGDAHSSKRLFDAMPEHDLVAWNALLAGHAQLGQPEAAAQTFDEIKMVERPDAICFVSIMTVCELEQCRECFVSMVGDFGVVARKQHYSCLVDVLGRAGHITKAMDLITNMPFEEDCVDWMCFLDACRRHSDVAHGAQGAKRLLEIDPGNSAALVVLGSMFTFGKGVKVVDQVLGK
ncbi:hypothetical protein SELMODRAFT_102230 [Selaginella moellendorffii]|uniref:Pentacotripeptide-repeat region of PRORP domain-containing protein n=1 Tax=Selaginella moellendorffii TaxID=88036 RepID=D8RU34_SELML|nr:hypothetical protein SELMODRAFT_102230 [Selaginella moellendorffii]